jgi:uncharacterized protein YecE (DUF72 family)
MRIRVGTCAWADHQHFYPAGLKPTDRLAYYARHFDVVEIDSSYYAIPPQRNFALWTDRTPDDFRFNVKAYGELTWHDRATPPREETIAAFREAMAPMRAAGKIGGLLFQFPPWYSANPENSAFIASLRDRFPDDIVIVEFRNTSWLAEQRREESLSLLRANGLAYSMVDAPQIGSGTSQKVVAATHSAMGLVRLHGRNAATWYTRAKSTGDRFNYLYSPAELAEWVPHIRAVAGQVRELHVEMNNNHANYAVRNAKDLMALLGMPEPAGDDSAERQLAFPGLA